MLAFHRLEGYNGTNMRRAVRAIVIKDGNLLVMHRNKFGHEYFTLVGGVIKIGETAEQALVRELLEETGITIAQPHLVIVEEAGDLFGTQYVYLCDYAGGGEPALSPHSEEAKISAMGKNIYTPMWMPLSELGKMPFRSQQLMELLQKSLRDGFSREPVQIHSA